MNIEDAVLLKNKLERDILDGVRCLVAEFKEKTSLSPRSITITMIDVTSCGDMETKYTVNGCEVGVDL